MVFSHIMNYLFMFIIQAENKVLLSVINLHVVPPKENEK